MKFKLQPVFKQIEASIPNSKTREKSLVIRRTSPASKTNYALEIKLGTSDFGYIWVGIFAVRFCTRKNEKQFERVFPARKEARFV